MTTIPTQSAHPWRATLRTVAAVLFAMVVTLAPVAPQIIDAFGLSAYGWAAGVLTAAAGITRVLAIPAVNDMLTRRLPALAAAPKDPAP